jgi:ligand-binding sensor domain-containing protein
MNTSLLQLLALFSTCSFVALGSCTHSSTAPTEGSTQLLKPSAGIRGIFEDNQGRFWFNSTEWACMYDPALRENPDGGFTYFMPGSPGVAIGRFQEDAKGRTWMQNSDGIYLYDGETFTPLSNRNYEDRGAWAKSEGDVWFGLDDGFGFTDEEGEWGVYRYHDGECTFLAFPDPPAGERSHFYPLTSEVMHAKDGTVWFGTFNAAVGFDGESFDFFGRERMGRLEDSRYVGIRGYHLDRQGRLWMADNGAGVYVYDGESVVHFTAVHDLEDDDVEGNALHRSFCINEDNDGNIWIGTAYSGIWRYQPSAEDPIGKGVFTNFDDEQGFPCEGVWTIYKSRSGELLFAGENPGGVYRFNGEGFERAF